MTTITFKEELSGLENNYETVMDFLNSIDPQLIYKVYINRQEEIEKYVFQKRMEDYKNNENIGSLEDFYDIMKKRGIIK